MTTLLLRISLPLAFVLASCTTTTTKVTQAVNEAQAAANVATTAAIVAQSAASAPRAPGAPPSPLPLFATVLQGTQRSACIARAGVVTNRVTPPGWGADRPDLSILWAPWASQIVTARPRHGPNA